MSCSKKGDIFEGHIEGCAFGGDGIVRHQGQVVFVPFSAPGDKISGQIVAGKKSFAIARLLNVISPSPYRTYAPCSYYGQCGGCQLQHIAYAQQLELKQRFVQDALTRIGRLPNVKVKAVIASEQRLHYRRHIRLHLRPDGRGYRVGYIGHDNQRLIEIDHCPIFNVAQASIIKDIKEMCRTLPAPTKKSFGEVTLFKAPCDRYVALFDLQVISSAQRVLEAELKHRPNLRGLIWRTGETHRQLGDCSLHFQLDGLKIGYSPLAFVQAHPEQSAKLYLELRNRIKAMKLHRVLDLYCGIGVMSLLLAREGLTIIGIEANPHALQLAHDNTTRNLIPDIQWCLGDVDEVADIAMRTFAPDVVIVNPPRGGLSQAVRDALLCYQPQEIFYVSCMPSTLARDLAFIQQGGYRVEDCQPYDMFPETTHVETLVQLSKTL